MPTSLDTSRPATDVAAYRVSAAEVKTSQRAYEQSERLVNLARGAYQRVGADAATPVSLRADLDKRISAAVATLDEQDRAPVAQLVRDVMREEAAWRRGKAPDMQPADTFRAPVFSNGVWDATSDIRDARSREMLRAAHALGVNVAGPQSAERNVDRALVSQARVISDEAGAGDNRLDRISARLHASLTASNDAGRARGNLLLQELVRSPGATATKYALANKIVERLSVDELRTLEPESVRTLALALTNDENWIRAPEIAATPENARLIDEWSLHLKPTTNPNVDRLLAALPSSMWTEERADGRYLGFNAPYRSGQ